jgi:hypothetical protein
LGLSNELQLSQALFSRISCIDHNDIYRDRLLCGTFPGSTGWPRIPGVDAVRVTEPSVIQLLGPSIVRSFHLAVEPNTCSLEIGLASEWTRADVRLLAVFSDKETELFFRIPIPNRTYDLILLRERDLGLVEINQPDLMFRCVYRNPSQCVFTQG